MRKTLRAEFIEGENQEVIGINLGADFCAEHEWGIDGLKRSFGIPIIEQEKQSWWKNIFSSSKPIMGVEKRAITKTPETLIKGEGSFTWRDYKKPKSRSQKTKIYYIGFKPYFLMSEDKNTAFDFYLKEIYDKEQKVWGWWSESCFLVVSTDKVIIDEMYQAFQDKDIVIMIGGNGGNPFSNGGLCLIKKSKIPAEGAKSLYEGDLDNWNLKQAASKTGIYERLEKADKKYFALSPSWNNKEKTEVRFWLNPYDQQNNNFGWYSVEELDMWAKNEGPILKENKK